MYIQQYTYRWYIIEYIRKSITMYCSTYARAQWDWSDLHLIRRWRRHQRHQRLYSKKAYARTRMTKIGIRISNGLSRMNSAIFKLVNLYGRRKQQISSANEIYAHTRTSHMPVIISKTISMHLSSAKMLCSDLLCNRCKTNDVNRIERMAEHQFQFSQ